MKVHFRTCAHDDKHGKTGRLANMGYTFRSFHALPLMSDCFCNALATVHVSRVMSVSCHPPVSITITILVILIMGEK